ncbi:MAG: type II toxin-antitoxin system RelE/ParE family toxin [Acidobacteriota bacterium]|jgi:proteic killer suppression protein|nr:type II toxin-antitoxin system RelE/ParE family toxin [Acidobacteriota bacterium]
MIQSFKHRGLRELFEKGKSKHIASDFAPKLLRQMDAINQADAPKQLNFPSYDLHELKGERTGTWVMKINKNWRLTFKFESGNAIDLDLEDYH